MRVGTLVLVFFLAVSCDLQDLGSLTRDWTPTLGVKALSPNHWTSREFAFMYVSVCLVLIFYLVTIMMLAMGLSHVTLC